MKANQKFTRTNDDGVSPVIAVILMVAITVVLSATVYVWVSGFGGNNSQPAKSIALAGDAPIDASGIKNLTVTAGTPSLHWSGFQLTINGVERDLAAAAATCETPALTEFAVCQGDVRLDGTALVGAGQTVSIPDVSTGDVLRIVDINANSVILTMTLG